MSDSRQSTSRVVITGVGLVSPLGIGADTFWQSLADGKSGLGPIRLLPYSAAPQNVGGEVKDFDESNARRTYLKKLRKSIKVMCREIQFGVASAALAVEHAGLNIDELDHERFGVDFGANLMLSPPQELKDACYSCVNGDDRRFHFEMWGSDGLHSMEPLWLLRYLPNMPACHIGIFADARGPNNSITLDEASGNLALGEASRIIQRNAADVMLAGTTGTRLHPVKTMHAALWDELASSSDPPEAWCRPFDLNRTGQVVAEAACTFLLEREVHAHARGATVLGTILGSGASCVASHQQDGHMHKALANAMRAALRDAKLEPNDIGHINAHGLASRRADIEETAAIHEVFGDDACEVPVTALKSCLGNAGSGCGTLELAGSVLGLRHGVVPATRNFETPDPQCKLNVVHGEPLPVANKIVLNLNVTRMGQASALIVAVA